MDLASSLLMKFTLGGGERVLTRIEQALGDRPGGIVLLRPIGSAGVDKEDLYAGSCSPIRQYSGAVLGHGQDADFCSVSSMALQFLAPIGLHDNIILQTQLFHVHHRAFGIARCVDDAQVRPDLLRGLRQIETVQAARHYDIGKHQIDIVMPAENVEGGDAVCGLDHFIAEVGKKAGGDGTDTFLVFDHQYLDAAHSLRRRGGGGLNFATQRHRLWRWRCQRRDGLPSRWPLGCRRFCRFGLRWELGFLLACGRRLGLIRSTALFDLRRHLGLRDFRLEAGFGIDGGGGFPVLGNGVGQIDSLHRKIDFDRRAVAFLAVDAHMTARFCSETIDHRQPKTRALAGGFGREEGLEDFIEESFRNP